LRTASASSWVDTARMRMVVNWLKMLLRMFINVLPPTTTVQPIAASLKPRETERNWLMRLGNFVTPETLCRMCTGGVPVFR
jgi:hypothetical protein